MDSSPVLRQQNRNKIQNDCPRIKIENSKMPGDPRSMRPVPVLQLPNTDTENQDPGSSDTGRKAPLRTGISRLPRLAKTARLHTPADFSQHHRRWEEKSLAGKAKKKRSSTRPLPFSMSQQRNSQPDTETTQPLTVLQSRTKTHAVQCENNKSSVHFRAHNIIAKTTKHSAKLQSNSAKKTSNSPIPGQTSNTFKSGDVPRLHGAAPSAPCAQPVVTADVCVDNMNLLSLKDPAKTSHIKQKVQGNLPEEPSDKIENFQPNQAALLSILQNEGISAASLRSAAPQTNSCILLPQRVSVMKSHQKVGPKTGSGTSFPFSPASTTLQSILQNEGLKATTPKNSVCPSGGRTSIYTAQRVPIRKNKKETTEGSVGSVMALKETPFKRWTPHRVPDTRHKPMSSMKWHPSPYINTPRLGCCNTKPPQGEYVVQRLFIDPDDEQSPNTVDKDLQVLAEKFPDPTLTSKSRYEGNIKTTTVDDDEVTEPKIADEQPFLQALQRESVIFFSTGKKLIRAPRFEKQENIFHQDEQGSVSSEQGKGLQKDEKLPHVEQQKLQINSYIQNLQKDAPCQKPCPISPASVLLQKRLALIEEQRMDEEVAIYTSFSVPAAVEFHPPRPRCGNPLASLLHFEESTRFVPISFELSAGPTSPHWPL